MQSHSSDDFCFVLFYFVLFLSFSSLPIPPISELLSGIWWCITLGDEHHCSSGKLLKTTWRELSSPVRPPLHCLCSYWWIWGLRWGRGFTVSVVGLAQLSVPWVLPHCSMSRFPWVIIHFSQRLKAASAWGRLQQALLLRLQLLCPRRFRSVR